MASHFNRNLQALVPSAGQVNHESVGRSILIVCREERQRRRWARAVVRLGFRPVLAETPSEGRRLLSSLVVRAAIVERDPACSAIERARSSLLLVALVSIPTLVVTDDRLSEDDLVRESRQLLALAAPRETLDMVQISRFHLQQYMSESTVRN